MKLFNQEINKLYTDDFGRKSGILLINKPTGITSHDLVDQVRQKLKMRRVGHAGALDPFATGLMIMLVGKATKCSNQFLAQDKEYLFEMVLGIATDTQDRDGKVIQVNPEKKYNQQAIEKILSSFTGDYDQPVPIFSSVKVHGIRLRELAHASNQITKEQKGNDNYATFILNKESAVITKARKSDLLSPKLEVTVKIPKRTVTIHSIELVNLKKITGKDIPLHNEKIDPKALYQLLQIKASVSKGTYIRQLVEDIGQKLDDSPAVLITLDRTKIGEIPKEQAIDIDKIE